MFKEYSDKSLALVLIEENDRSYKKIYIKANILGKNISKNINIEKQNLTLNNYYEELTIQLKKELINLIKSKNLIDIRTPAF